MSIKLALALLVALLIGITKLPTWAAAPHFDNIFVFGDSLSDVGNAYKSTKGDFPPSLLYFQGRYSNGPVWVEYLAFELKLLSTTDTNFAFGGATTGNSTAIPPGLITQVKRFTTTHTSADPNALYIIWAGTNDYLRGTTDTTTPVNNLVVAVKSLATAGAKNIVVVNLPDLGKLPDTRTSQHAALLSNATRKHNSRLASSLVALDHEIGSDVSITYLDVNSLFNQVIKIPEKFGFTDVTNPCLSRGTMCNNPDKYLFWDSIHPTTAAHKLFATLIPTPRPAPPPVSSFEIFLALGLIVFGAVGSFIFKHKKAAKNSQ